MVKSEAKEPGSSIYDEIRDARNSKKLRASLIDLLEGESYLDKVVYFRDQDTKISGYPRVEEKAFIETYLVTLFEDYLRDKEHIEILKMAFNYLPEFQVYGRLGARRTEYAKQVYLPRHRELNWTLDKKGQHNDNMQKEEDKIIKILADRLEKELSTKESRHLGIGYKILNAMRPHQSKEDSQEEQQIEKVPTDDKKKPIDVTADSGDSTSEKGNANVIKSNNNDSHDTNIQIINIYTPPTQEVSPISDVVETNPSSTEYTDLGLESPPQPEYYLSSEIQTQQKLANEESDPDELSHAADANDAIVEDDQTHSSPTKPTNNEPQSEETERGYVSEELLLLPGDIPDIPDMPLSNSVLLGKTRFGKRLQMIIDYLKCSFKKFCAPFLDWLNATPAHKSVFWNCIWIAPLILLIVLTVVLPTDNPKAIIPEDSEIVLVPNEIRELNVTILPSAAEDAELFFSSSDTEILMVNSKNGMMAAQDGLDGEKEGTAKIYISAEGFRPIPIQPTIDKEITIKASKSYSSDDPFVVAQKIRPVGAKEWADNIYAQVGDELEIQIEYTNISMRCQEDVLVKYALPDSLEYVPHSIVQYNAFCLEGAKAMNDSLFEKDIYIGDYNTGANALIRFMVKVRNDDSPNSDTIISHAECQVADLVFGDDITIIVRDIE